MHGSLELVALAAYPEHSRSVVLALRLALAFLLPRKQDRAALPRYVALSQVGKNLLVSRKCLKALYNQKLLRVTIQLAALGVRGVITEEHPPEPDID